MLKRCCMLMLLCVAPAALAKPLRVLVGMHKPPYIDIHTQQGYELELLTLVATHMQQTFEFSFVPNQRILALLQKGEGDIATLQRGVTRQPQLQYGCPYIRYQNVAVTLHRNRLLIKQIADLTGLSVLAFQNATNLLPPSYGETVKKTSSYQETTNQRTQVDMLQKNRVQVVIMDIHIFNFYNQQAAAAAPVDIHPLFTDTEYRTAFRDRQLAQAFDRALIQVQQSPAYNALQQKYFQHLAMATLSPCVVSQPD